MEEQQTSQFANPPKKKKKRTGLIVFIVVLVVVLIFAGYLLAQALLWKKVKDTINEGSGQVDLSQNCRQVEIQAIALVDTSGGAGTSYDLTLKRTGSGDSIEVGGVKAVLFDDNENSGVLDWNYNLEPLRTHTESLTLTTPLPNANRVKITVYLINNLGEPMMCPETITKDF